MWPDGTSIGPFTDTMRFDSPERLNLFDEIVNFFKFVQFLP